MFKIGDQVTDGITDGVEARKQRGLEIAAMARIEKVDGFYMVPSVTSPRPTVYRVKYNPAGPTCTCPDHETRRCRCKHIWAVSFMLKRERNSDGSETITQSVTVTKTTRQTYGQDWPSYNKAQQNEKREFQRLLADLCAGIPTPAPKTSKGGRPTLPLRDAVFACVFKIYSTVSARRFTSDLCDAQSKGFISRVPHFNSILNYLENPAMFPLLVGLIERASLPLKSLETSFAVDSTGFAYSRFVRWFDIKYNSFTQVQQWVKAHFCTGVTTNVVTSIEILEKDTNDCPLLPALVKRTSAQGFNVNEVSADKGYSSRENHDEITALGAMPFIAFKANTTGGVGGSFEKMWHYFCLNRESFLAHYHQRSNVESTVMMVKSKFGDSVRSKTEIAAKNEVLCKFLCHNICCVIQAMYELDVQPAFDVGSRAGTI
jgi:hypothetical protein